MSNEAAPEFTCTCGHGVAEHRDTGCRHMCQCGCTATYTEVALTAEVAELKAKVERLEEEKSDALAYARDTEAMIQRARKIARDRSDNLRAFFP